MVRAQLAKTPTSGNHDGSAKLLRHSGSPSECRPAVRADLLHSSAARVKELESATSCGKSGKEACVGEAIGTFQVRRAAVLGHSAQGRGVGWWDEGSAARGFS